MPVKTVADLFKDMAVAHECAMKSKNTEALMQVLSQAYALQNQAVDSPSILMTVGTILMQLGFHGVAIQILERTRQLAPDMSQVWNNLGTAYHLAHRNDMARKYLTEANRLAIKATGQPNGEILNNMGTMYVNQGDPNAALDILDQAVKLTKYHPQSCWNSALALLELGRFEGFAWADYGLQSGDRPLKKYVTKKGEIPMWNGEAGKKLIVYDEQGIGDRILFANCLRDLLREDIPPPILDCHDRMIGVYRDSFGDGFSEYHPTAKDIVYSWPSETDADAFIPTGALQKFFWGKPEDIDKSPYIFANKEKSMDMKAKLAALGPPPYIGIAWSGGIQKTYNDYRSFKISNFAPVTKAMGGKGTFVCLQYTEEAEEKCARSEDTLGVHVHYLPEVREHDYALTVALVDNLDLCIVPNTAIVHLCGAMGKQCWTLTPDRCAWRYGPVLERPDHMLWYGDHVTQYHMPEGEGAKHEKAWEAWACVFERIAGDIKQLFGG